MTAASGRPAPDEDPRAAGSEMPRLDGGRPLRILLFARQLNASTSGVGTYASQLVRGLAASGHAVSVAVPADEADELPGVRSFPLSLGRFDPTPDRWIAAGRAFARLLEREGGRHDVGHFVDAREAWDASPSTLPLIGTVNDTYALDWADPTYPRRYFRDRIQRSAYYRFLRLAEPRAYGRLAKVVANSERVRQQLLTGYRVEAGKVCLVHYGVSEPPQARAERLPGEPAILFVGGNFQRKGLPTLLQALARLVDRVEDPRLHVVGRDRNAARVAERVRALGLESRVVFHGWLPNPRVRLMMAGATVFALPSITEGFGLVYVEALLGGTPVVASRWSGACELFDGDAAFMAVDPTDPEEIAGAIEQLHARASRSPGGFAGPATRKAAALTRERMVGKTAALYREVLAATGRGPAVSSRSHR